MVKQQQFKIDYVRDNNKIKEIALSKNVIIEALQIYLDKEFKDGEHISELIKVILKKGHELETLKKGITYNNIDYIPLLTSSSMQKAEEDKYKLEYIFIKKDLAGFKDKLEDILSLSKCKNWENKEMSIVKDVTARLGLATSGTYKINHNFSFIILPEKTYTYLTNNYIAFRNKDYSKTVDITSSLDPKAYEHVFSDGFGLMSNKMASIIKKQLNKDYRVDFAIIRGYDGLAIKGLCLRFDWNKYFKENYIKDTDFIKKTENGFEIKDYKDEWKDTNVDFILTESQVKWLKNWNNLEEWRNAKDNFEDKYKTIINSLYITKINKNSKMLKTHILTNYQLLNNLAITSQELEQISKATEDYYKKILDYDIDAIRLFMGDIARFNDTELSASTKVQFLLQTIGDNALKIREVREIIQNMITKKISEVAGGKVYVEGGYKLAACCPISFCNWIMTRDTGDNGLKEREYYIPKWNNEKVVMSRNPIACFQEIQITEIVDKENINKWLGDYTSELIFYNQKDDTAMKMSGMDFDGDGNLVIKNNIIYNSVIKPDKIFVNLSDSKVDTPKHKYSLKQRFEDEIASSGNMIGKIANCTSVINSLAQRSYYFKKDEYGIAYEWKDLFLRYLNKKFKSDRKTLKEFDENTRKEEKENFKKCLEKNLKNNKIEEEKNLSIDKQKELIAKHFKKYKLDSYKAIEFSMMAIDAPKTLKFPSKDELKQLEKYLNSKNPRFLCYLDKCKKDETKFYNSTLEMNASRIAYTLLKENLKLKKGEFKNELDKQVYYASAKSKEILYKELEKYKNDICILNATILDLYKEFKECKDLEKIRNKFNLSEDEYNEKEVYSFKTLYFIDKYRDIIKNLDLSIVVDNLLQLKVSTNFLLNIAFDTLETCIKNTYKDVTKTYIEDKNGDIDWLFKRYRKIDTKLSSNRLINKDIIKHNKKLGQDIIKLSFKKNDDVDIEIKDILTVEEDYLIDKNNNKLELYKDKKGLIEDNKKIEILDYKINKKSVQIEVKIIN